MANEVPWLTLPGEQLAAMERGASLGLARRAQDTNEREAMQRLQLAYNQMAMQEQDRQRAQAMAAQRQQAADALRMINQQRMFLAEQRAADAANRPPKRDIRAVGGGLYDVTDPTKVNPLVVPPEKPDKAKSDALQREEFKSALARVAAARKELAVLLPESPRRTRWEKELSDALDDVERLKGSGAASALEKAPINVTTPNAPQVPQGFDLFGTMGQSPEQMGGLSATPRLLLPSSPTGTATSSGLRYQIIPEE